MHDLFIGEIPKGLVVHHKCNVKACINPHHLEAVTPSQNAVLGFGKLTDQQVQEIRDLKEQGLYARVIAAEYGVSTQYVAALCRKEYRK